MAGAALATRCRGGGKGGAGAVAGAAFPVPGAARLLHRREDVHGGVNRAKSCRGVAAVRVGLGDVCGQVRVWV